MTTPAIKYVIVERQQMSGRYVALRGLSFATEAQAKAHIEQKFWPAYRERLFVESRIVKADDTEQRMTCQCCNRQILAKQGSIALHGYTRPGTGWQTASCFGAKKLPWEVDRSAVALLIRHLKSWLERSVEARDEVASDAAPVTANYTGEYDRRTGRSKLEQATFTRETFDAACVAHPKMISGYYGDDRTFDAFKRRDLFVRDRDIKQLKRDIAEFTARYDGWKQTHRREGNTWVAL